MKRHERLDPRAWLIWGVAMSLVPMLGRNPYPLIAGLIVALTVRSAMATEDGAGWGRLLRLAVIFATIGVLFNLVTYHGGDREIAVVPGWVPIAGGPLTLNAVVYGVLSGLSLVLLVTVWSTIAQHIDWSDVVRLTPPSLSGIAIAGSIAFTLVPKTIEAFIDIREAQSIRGFRARGPRDIVPFVTPLLTTGLERAVTLSEALESRGYGGSDRVTRVSTGRMLTLVVALTGLAASAFLISTGRATIGLSILTATVLAGYLLLRTRSSDDLWRPTRYRDIVLTRNDRIVGGVALAVIVAILAINSWRPEAIRYEPYPAISWPSVSLPIIGVIALLMAPVFLAPLPSPERTAPGR
ncbi:energy-coupling factor transporter transmembrane component T [soil metagenome]